MTILSRTEDLPPPCYNTPVITDIKATVERAMLGSGSDRGVELGAIVVDVGRALRWDLVVMGEVELGAIVVDVDKFWAQKETEYRRVRVMWLFLKAWAMRKSVPSVVLRHTIYRDA